MHLSSYLVYPVLLHEQFHHHAEDIFVSLFAGEWQRGRLDCPLRQVVEHIIDYSEPDYSIQVLFLSFEEIFLQPGREALVYEIRSYTLVLESILPLARTKPTLFFTTSRYSWLTTGSPSQDHFDDTFITAKVSTVFAPSFTSFSVYFPCSFGIVLCSLSHSRDSFFIYCARDTIGAKNKNSLGSENQSLG